MARILGLDLGTNSIGWAIVEKERGNDFQLIDKGVRIFQEGVKIEKGNESSKAEERTNFRSARRLKYRRKLRKIQTLTILSNHGFCPKLLKSELDNWRYKKQYPLNEAFMNWQKTDEATQTNPYYYRALAVEEKLDLSNEVNRLKLGRAFYHMAQRRGFLSNRLEGTKESDGVVTKGIEDLSNAKAEKTLGQYFFELYQKGEKIRGRYTHRDAHYLNEFERICHYQNIPNYMAEQLKRAIFYQRPLKSQKGSIGKCVFEPKKPRCAVSRPEFEEYRMLCFINNIKIKSPDDEKLRELNDVERIKIRPVFFRKSKDYFDFEDIAKQLAPKHQYKFYKEREKFSEDWLFNFPMNTTVSGCPVSARFKDIFGNEFMTDNYTLVKNENGVLSKKVIDAWHALFTFDSEEKLKEFAQYKLGLIEEQRAEYLKVRLKQDYASLSLKAIRNITPYLNAGLIYSHAVFLANMHKAIPADVWSIPDNREIIQKEILNIIETQNLEKQLVEIVNGVIKRNRDEGAVWSEEASSIFRKEIIQKVESSFGANRYALFTEEKRHLIEQEAVSFFERQMQKKMGVGEFVQVKRIDDRVKDFLMDNFDVDGKILENLYHPSAVEVYKEPVKREDGRLYLGSPMVSAVRNPMAMRALHQLRKLINTLIKNELIDANLKIHIEMARDLKNANERKALQSWQSDRQKLRNKYAEMINEHYQAKGKRLSASDDDILKYQLWEEQNHKCIYTGREIGLENFLGANPEFDIEHTIPRSLSCDNSMVNNTLCENNFNRAVKRNKIPSELQNHDEILARIEHWKERYEELDKQIQRTIKRAKNAADKTQKDTAIQARHKLTFERDYWRNKYRRFTMKDVPDGFKNSQIVDTGIITKYSRLYLKTLFGKVYTVKGNTVADFRKIWGLQEEYEKKERINHIHHCIDAITIACITKENYESLANFYHEWDKYKRAELKDKPQFDKPWPTFTEDLKRIEDEVLISHYTPDVLPKQSKRVLRKRGKKILNKDGKLIILKGDTARGALHQQTFYGAIAHDKNGIVTNDSEGKVIPQYVVRKHLLQSSLNPLKQEDIKSIVDGKVRVKIENAVAAQGFKAAMDNVIWMNEVKKIPIKKVRVYVPSVKSPLHFETKKQRDKSTKGEKPYKEEFNVVTGGNYLMALYEGKDKKGRFVRQFELVNNLNAGAYFKYSTRVMANLKDIGLLEGLISHHKESTNIEMSLRAILKIGTMVIFWKYSPEEIAGLNVEEIRKRLYKITSFESDGRIQLRFHQVAKQDKELLAKSEVRFDAPEEKLRVRVSKFNAWVEGFDFKLSPLGEIELLH